MAMRRVIVVSAIHAEFFDRMRAMADDENASEERDVLKEAIRMMLYQNRVAHLLRAQAVRQQEDTRPTSTPTSERRCRRGCGGNFEGWRNLRLVQAARTGVEAPVEITP